MDDGSSKRISLNITANDGSKKTGYLVLKILQKNEKIKRALKALGTCWSFAVAAVFLPLVHFVLVPSCLLAGIVLAIIKGRRDEIIIEGKASCPLCNKEIIFKGEKLDLPARIYCPNCRNHLNVEQP